MIARLSLLFTLAAIQVAASDSCQRNVSISSQRDADAIHDCDEIEGSVTISHHASGAITLDNLQEVKGRFMIEGTSDLKEISASKLEKIEHELSVKNNGELSQLSMANLQAIGGDMEIEGNEDLKQLRLDNLENIEGDMTIKGEFSSISLSKLNEVKGQGSIESSGSMSCSDLSRLQSDDIFGGTYSCSAATTSSPSTGLSTGGKVGVIVGVILGVALMAAAIWFMVLRRKRKTALGTVSTAAVDGMEKGGALQANKAPLTSLTPAVLGKISDKPTPELDNSEPDTPMLDGGNVHEAPGVPAGGSRNTTQCFELDAGPVSGAHQPAMH